MRKRLLACITLMSMVPQAAMQRLAAWGIPLSVLVGSVRAAHAKLFLNQAQALEKAFPSASRIERKTAYLSPEQVSAIETASGTRVEMRVLSYYVGYDDKTLLGTAYFDTQPVRTMPMTYMTVVKPDGSLAFVEILAFHEPEDYLPRFSWLKLFQGKGLTPGLRLRRDIPNVTGASLTCQSITDGVRKMLSVYQVGIR